MEEDARSFSTLQSRLDRLAERRQDLRRQLTPIRKRLIKYMTEKNLPRLQCVNYVLSVPDDDNDPDDDEDNAQSPAAKPAVFSEQRIAAFLSTDQLSAYCLANQRPQKRARRVVCERDVIDVAESETDTDSDTPSA